ncbi:hypothetical protein BKA63DRAFT_587445 [Paraphoma chrysanthemicola]|nr:hypothetical protein BKA63DRAFT_587445 [Paraphoma chrysanthemicola]
MPKPAGSELSNSWAMRHQHPSTPSACATLNVSKRSHPAVLVNKHTLPSGYVPKPQFLSSSARHFRLRSPHVILHVSRMRQGNLVPFPRSAGHSAESRMCQGPFRVVGRTTARFCHRPLWEQSTTSHLWNDREVNLDGLGLEIRGRLSPALGWRCCRTNVLSFMRREQSQHHHTGTNSQSAHTTVRGSCSPYVFAWHEGS